MGSVSDQLVAVVGATGTGKSALSLDIAEAIVARGGSAEIVNADAMQLYRGMDIGTAKLPLDERRGIPHHLLDVLEPSEEASVARYQTDARAAVAAIRARGAVPILVGGSGLYVSSVIWDFRFPGTDEAIRARLESELIERGPGALAERLRSVDPAAAAAIGSTNGRRIVRALEVVEMTGEPFGAGLPDESRLVLPTTIIGLRTPRAELIPRLDRRVEDMWANGLVAEAQSLVAAGIGVTAGRAIGYAQAIAQSAGELSEKEAIAQSAALTRRYARRQVGWFNRYPATWFESDDPERAGLAVQLFLNRA
jgi:tRNA dimethylallyltransferase